MKVLAFETSAKSASVAVVENGQVLASAYQCTGLTHSRTLMPMLEAMLKNSELTLNDMDLLAVAAGPGSFTGLRIGVSAVKGLAFAADKPCCAVSTLQSMAAPLSHMEGSLIICAMDARRQQIYNALFTVKEGKLLRECPDRAVSLAEVAGDIQKNEKIRTMRKIIVGDGAELCYDYLSESGIACEMAPAMLLRQSAVGVALAADAAETVSAAALCPVYLRISQAERERNARLAKEDKT